MQIPVRYCHLYLEQILCNRLLRMNRNKINIGRYQQLRQQLLTIREVLQNHSKFKQKILRTLVDNIRKNPPFAPKTSHHNRVLAMPRYRLPHHLIRSEEVPSLPRTSLVLTSRSASLEPFTVMNRYSRSVPNLPMVMVKRGKAWKM